MSLRRVICLIRRIAEKLLVFLLWTVYPHGDDVVAVVPQAVRVLLAGIGEIEERVGPALYRQGAAEPGHEQQGESGGEYPVRARRWRQQGVYALQHLAADGGGQW